MHINPETDEMFVEQSRNGQSEQLYAGAIYRNVGTRYINGIAHPIDVIGQSYRNRRDGKLDFNIPMFLANIEEHEEGLKILSNNPHPNLVRYYGMNKGIPLPPLEHLKDHLKGGSDVFVYYEYVKGTNLYSQLEKAGSFRALANGYEVDMLEGLFEGVEHFHNVGQMVHKDITTRNIILADRDNPKHRLVLGDLELCENIGQAYSLHAAMSPNFSPMELLLVDQIADVRSDVASLAATIAQVLVWDELDPKNERWVKKIDHNTTEELNWLNNVKDHQVRVKHLREIYWNTSELHEGVLASISKNYSTEIAQVLAKASAFNIDERYENIESFRVAFMEAFRSYHDNVMKSTGEIDVRMVQLGLAVA